MLGKLPVDFFVDFLLTLVSVNGHGSLLRLQQKRVGHGEYRQ
jgi:hypothetical protein